MQRSPMQQVIGWIRASRKFLLAAITTLLIWLQSQGHIQLAGAEAATAEAIYGALIAIIGSITVYAVPNRPAGGDRGGPANRNDTLRSPAVVAVLAIAAVLLAGCVSSGGSTGGPTGADRSLRSPMATLAQGSADFNGQAIEAVIADELTPAQMRNVVRASNTVRATLDLCLPNALDVEGGQVSWNAAVTCGLPAAAAIASIADLVTLDPDGAQLPVASVLRAAARLALLPSPAMEALQQEITAAEDRDALLAIEILDGAFASMHASNDALRTLVAARLAAVGARAALPRT